MKRPVEIINIRRDNWITEITRAVGLSRLGSTVQVVFHGGPQTSEFGAARELLRKLRLPGETLKFEGNNSGAPCVVVLTRSTVQ